jgi:hypothetical protein
MTPRIVAGTHGDGPRISLVLGRNGGPGLIPGYGPYTGGLRNGGIQGDGPYIIGLRIMMTDRTEQNRRLLFSLFCLSCSSHRILEKETNSFYKWKGK